MAALYLVEAIDGEKNLNTPLRLRNIEGETTAEHESEVNKTTYYEITAEEYTACQKKISDARRPFQEAQRVISVNGQLLTQHIAELKEIEIGVRAETSFTQEAIEAVAVEKYEAEDFYEQWRENARQGKTIYER